MSHDAPQDDPVEHITKLLQWIHFVDLQHQHVGEEVEGIPTQHELDDGDALFVDVFEDD